MELEFIKSKSKMACSKSYLTLRLKHGHDGQRQLYPCTYYECRSFTTWNALKTHLSRCHVNVLGTRSAELRVCTCPLCPGSEIPSSRVFFHINNHLKRYETVTCVFQIYILRNHIRIGGIHIAQLKTVC